MNISVVCSKPRCGPTLFTTGLDSFHNETAACPKCKRSDFVYMVNEEGEMIHPTECCPTCNKPALLMERCRCAYYCIKCANGHEWHRCVVHKKLVVGNGHDRPERNDRCTCEEAP